MNATHPLGELIQSAQDKNGWSTRDLQRRAESLGLDMKHSNFSRLKNQELVSIKGTVIHALADVLQVPVHRVAQAAMASMGVEVPVTQPALEDVVRDSQEFSARDRQIIQGLVDTIRTLDATTQEEVVGNGRNHPTHMNQAGESPASPKAKKVPYVDPHAHPDADSAGNVPLPANYYELAANTARNYGAEEELRASARGEETQDSGHDD
ncbi:helix-turn-helix transcriptional regulator [Specibacter sp. NPDC078692]|uniref:helix-turn-helix domain-containing protein n=1 Tax=Specibacter sp. NPDC078692 TaxID=3155818 RepID=UPI00344A3FF0